MLIIFYSCGLTYLKPRPGAALAAFLNEHIQIRKKGVHLIQFEEKPDL